MKQSRFQAGQQDPQPFAVRMNLLRAEMNEMRAGMLARYVEFWCENNAFGPWHVEQDARELSVSFERQTDVVLFLISEEYTYFVPSATRRPRASDHPTIGFVLIVG